MGRHVGLGYTPGSETSEDAAASMVKPSKNQRQIAWEYIRAQGPKGVIYRELKELFGMDGPRLTELHRLGRVTRTGNQRKTSTGRYADVYVAVEPEFWTDKRPGWPVPKSKPRPKTSPTKSLKIATKALEEIVKRGRTGGLFAGPEIQDIATRALGTIQCRN